MSQFFHHNCGAEWVARPQSLQGKVCNEVGWRQGAHQRSRERNWGQGQPTHFHVGGEEAEDRYFPATAEMALVGGEVTQT